MKLVNESTTFKRGLSDEEIRTSIIGKLDKDEVFNYVKNFNYPNVTTGVNTKGTPIIIVKLDPGYLKLGKYDQAGWLNHVYSVEYTLTVIPEREDYVSVRKYWKGICGKTDHFASYYYQLSQKDVKEFYKSTLNERKDRLIDAVLLGRFKTVTEALNRIKLNIEKERKKKDEKTPS
jgi:hypothetical protein